MKDWIKQHINAILGTILAHLLIVLVALILKINTTVEYVESPIIIDPEMMADEQKPEENDNTEDIDINKYMANLTSAGSNYRGVNENLRENKDLSMDEMRKMYEEQILREKYGDEYENKMNQDNVDIENPETDNNRTNKTNNRVSTQQIDNTNRPCLVKAILDDSMRQTRYLHIPVFTCQGSGTVEIGITLSPEGKVVSTKLLSVQATTDKDCLVEAATAAAKKSRFAIKDIKQNQGGKIIYSFMNQ